MLDDFTGCSPQIFGIKSCRCPSPASVHEIASCSPSPPASSVRRSMLSQGLGGQLIEEKEAGSSRDNGARGKVVRRSRLGGMLNYYHRDAA
jgi:hypothetical protein